MCVCVESIARVELSVQNLQQLHISGMVQRMCVCLCGCLFLCKYITMLSWNWSEPAALPHCWHDAMDTSVYSCVFACVWCVGVFVCV